jgi:hypothetical protein
MTNTQRDFITHVQPEPEPAPAQAGGDCYKALVIEREPTLIDPFGQRIAVFTDAEDCQQAANALNTVADLAFAIGEAIDQLQAFLRARTVGCDKPECVRAALETLNSTSLRKGELTTDKALALLRSAIDTQRVPVAAGVSPSPWPVTVRGSGAA